jgi:membrane-bound acyltransferase YfiQ involved in biofilm formation
MIRRLLYLNGVSITCVILFHAAGMGFVAMFAWAHRYLPAGVPAASQIGSPSYFGLRFIEQLIIFCIPAFLFVSGYFIAVATGKNRSTIGWEVVWARLKMLWIPYLLWTAIILVLQVILEDKSLSLRRLLLDVFTGETNEVMYFIPLLTQFYLLAPLLVWLAKKNWRLLLVGVLILQIAVQLLAYPMFLGWDLPNAASLPNLAPKWFFISKVLWFPLGVIFGLNLEQLKPFLQRWRWAFLTVALLAIPVGVLEWELYFRLSGLEWLSHRETLVDTVYSLAVILSFLAFAQARLPLPRQMEQLGVKSYGIYLTHALFIQYAARLVYHLAPQLLAYQIVLLPLLILVGFAGPLVLMYLFERSPLRPYYKYVFG